MQRVIVINHGKLRSAGRWRADRMAPFKVLEIDLERDLDGQPLDRFGEVVATEARKITLKIPKDAVPAATTRVLAEVRVLDLTISDPPIEDVITQVFRVAPAPTATPI